MKLHRQILLIGSVLVATVLVQALPPLAHEKRFHVPKTKIKVTPGTKTPSNSSNSTQMLEMKPQSVTTPTPKEQNIDQKTLSSVNTSSSDNINLVPKPGELVFSLLVGGTLLVYYLKRQMYK